MKIRGQQVLDAKVAFQSGFVSALRSVGFDIGAVGEPKEEK